MTATVSHAWSLGPDWIHSGRIPCLDGLRGVAISLVVFSHALGTTDFPFPIRPSESSWNPLSLLGPLGVSIFFVLSGFLITLLLLRERERAAAISIAAFYRRRALRILPAYAAYLLVLLGMSAAGRMAAEPRDWVLALTYTSSIFNPHRWEFAHTWSLSIEEQFYLAWPLILAALSTRNAMVAAALCVAATLAGRLLVLLFLPAYAWWLDYFTPTRLDCIAIGCLLALSTTEVTFMQVTSRWRPRFPYLAAASASLLVLWFALSTPALAIGLFADLGVTNFYDQVAIPVAVAKNAIVGVLVALFIWTVAQCPLSLPGRVLESKPLALLGAMSYSLYLWQQFFLNWDATGWIYRWPANLLLTLLAAVVSYLAIERPFLKLKSKTIGSGAISASGVPAGSLRTERGAT